MNIALILSGGVGKRLSSGVPKQYISVAGKMVVTHCAERFLTHPMIDTVQIVAAEEWQGRIASELGGAAKLHGFSEPGENRQLSIYNALQDIAHFADKNDVVIIHDAARPMVSEDLISACLSGIAGHDGVMPVLPMTDTVYYSADGKRVDHLLERERIFAGQAPEAFYLGKYLAANEALLPDAILTINGSTEPAVLAGLDVVTVPGDRSNFKITTMDDLERYRGLME